MKAIYLLFGLVLSIAVTACNCSTKSTNPTEVTDTIKVTIDELMRNPDKYVEQLVQVTGECVHICMHTGPKAFLMTSDSTQLLKCIALPQMHGRFAPDCQGKEMKVTGVFREERISSRELRSINQARNAQVALLKRNGTKPNDSLNLRSSYGCQAEQKSYGQENIQTLEEEISDFKTRINQRKTAEGKDYLSFYYLDATEYQVK